MLAGYKVFDRVPSEGRTREPPVPWQRQGIGGNVSLGTVSVKPIRSEEEGIRWRAPRISEIPLRRRGWFQ